ncbi:MAG TPA: uroporphyrinogen decarboxylase family protein [Bacteroidota bacterium]|nr:uroporphyrinogen decarboxylase family protein [Bacteroidota bacterium]
MTSRLLIRNIIARRPVPRCGFWMGNPHPDTLPIYYRYFGVDSLEGLHLKLKSDFRWITPQFIDSTYRHPQGKGIFDIWKYKKTLGDPGPLANCTTVAEVEAYDWPSLEYLDFTECIAQLRAAGECYRASGFWCPFFHDVMDLFGVECFMMNLHERPDVVHAVLDRVCGFYYEANERFYREAGSEVDGFFFGNDFGTQRDLLVSPSQLEEFIFPWFRKLTGQAHRFGYQVILHSCGSVHRVIGTLIDGGVECLHPLQALAGNMDAATLARDFRGKIAFLGGIDTQDLLVNGTPEEVKADVRRVKSLLGPHLIVSPSHEALLPNIPPENVVAMAEEATAPY